MYDIDEEVRGTFRSDTLCINLNLCGKIIMESNISVPIAYYIHEKTSCIIYKFTKTIFEITVIDHLFLPFLPICVQPSSSMSASSDLSTASPEPPWTGAGVVSEQSI